MANLRFHEKYHGTLHHTVSSTEYPGSATDPIASKARPFIGNFHLAGSLSASDSFVFNGRLGLGNPTDKTFLTLQEMTQASYKYGVPAGIITIPSSTRFNDGICFGGQGNDSYPLYLHRSGSETLRIWEHLIVPGTVRLGVGGNTLKPDAADLTSFTGANPTLGVKHHIDKDPDYVAQFEGANVHSKSYGIKVFAGTDNTDSALALQSHPRSGSKKLMWVTGLGRVGIGTSNPVTTMHIMRQNLPGSGGSGGTLCLENNGETDIFFKNNNSGNRWQLGDNTNGFYLYGENITHEKYAWVCKSDTGRIGLGRLNPERRLEVYSAHEDATIRVESTAAWSGLEFKGINSENSWIYKSRSTSNLHLYANGRTRLYLAPTGEIIMSDALGSNWDTPYGEVTIRKPFKSENYQLSLMSDNTTDDRCGLSFLGSDGDRHANIYSDKNAALYITNNDNRPMIFRTNGSERMRIMGGDGNITMGSGDPAAGYRVEVKAGAAGGILAQGGPSRFYAMEISRSGNFLTSPDIYDPGGKGLVLGRNVASADLTINASGQVGVNCISSGTNALKINGNVQIINGELTVSNINEIDTTTFAVTDPVLEVGANTVSDSASAKETDPYDRGVKVTYGTGSKSVSGFFGFDRIESKFVWIPEATWDSTGNNAYGAYGAAKFGGLEVTANMNAAGGNINEFTSVNGVFSNRLTVSNEARIYDLTTRSGSNVMQIDTGTLRIRKVGDVINTAVAIGQDSCVGTYQLTVNRSVYVNSEVNTNQLFYRSGGGGWNANSSNAVLFGMNAGSDRYMRVVTPGGLRTWAGLSDAATTSIATIRSTEVHVHGGTMKKTSNGDGDLRFVEGHEWAHFDQASRTFNLMPWGNDNTALRIKNYHTASNQWTPRVWFLPERGHNTGWHIQASHGHFKISHNPRNSTAHNENFLLAGGRGWILGNEIWHKGNFNPMAYGVATFNGRMGAVTMTRSDINNAAGGTVWSSNNDGPGSGLNADYLDGLSYQSFVRRDAKTSAYKGIRWHGGYDTNHQKNATYPYDHYGQYEEGDSAGSNPYKSIGKWSWPYAKLAINHHTGINFRAYHGYGGFQFYGNTYYHSELHNLRFSICKGDYHVRNYNGEYYAKGHLVWNAGNDGAGSGLDAGYIGGLRYYNVARKKSTNYHYKYSWNANEIRDVNVPSYVRSSQNASVPTAYGVIHNFENYPGGYGSVYDLGGDEGSAYRSRYIHQLCFAHSAGNVIFIRNSGGNGTSWSQWGQIWTTDSLKDVSQLTNDQNYVRFSGTSSYSLNQTINTGDTPRFRRLLLNTTDQGGAVLSIKPNNERGITIFRYDSTNRHHYYGHDGSGPYIRFSSTSDYWSLRTPAGRHAIRFYPDGYYPGSAGSGLDTQRNPNTLQLNGTRISWCDKDGNNQSDAYYLEKTNNGDGDNQLRLYIHDNENERFEIWGDSCRGGSCNNHGKARRAFYFQANGVMGNTGPMYCDGANINAWRSTSIGNCGHGQGWGGLSHYSRRGQWDAYAIIQSTDGKYTLINKKSGGGYIGFRVSNNQKMAIHDTGNVVIGTRPTDSGYKLQVDGSVRVSSTGYFSGDVVAYYSDRRLKTNLNTITDYKKILNGLTGYRFNWNNTAVGIVPQENYKADQVGLIAQDVEAVLPEAVHTWKGEKGEKGMKAGYKTIKYDKLVPVLVEALKSALSKNEELEERLIRLERIIEDKY